MPARRTAALLALLACASCAAAARGAPGTLPPPPLDLAAPGSGVRALLAAAPPSVGTIYNNGDLRWRSWSWGLSRLDTRAAGSPMPGAKASLCMAVQPYGALSLKSLMPFSLDGALGFYLRGGASASASDLGGLEVQFEGSAPGAHSITASLTLRELLAGPQGVDAAAADAALAAAARGEWVPVKASLLQFAQGGPQGSGFKADRLTIGWCVQRLEGCAAGAPPVELCLDKIALVFP